MKKLFLIPLMACAMLFSATAGAVEVSTKAQLQDALKLTGEIILTTDIPMGSDMMILMDGQKVTLDLNGKEIHSTAGQIIRIQNGSLNIINSSETPATISGTGYAAVVFGSPTDVADYSTLIIGENINVTTTNDYGLVLAQGTSAKPHHGYGIVVEVNGYVQAANTGLWVLGNIQDKEGNIPQVTVGATGSLIGDDGTGLYGGGYANYTIEGAVSGAVGIYAKAGNYDIKGDATITSTYTGSHQTVVPNGDGFTGGEGSAIVADSKAGYAGNMEFEISGNPTITTMAADGYAIEELNSDLDKSQTKSIAISGGTFKGTISTTIEVKEAIVLNGTITGGTFSTDVTEYLNNITGVITPTIEDGKTIYVVAEKPVSTPDWINNINNATAASYVRLNGNGEQTLTKDIEAKYLVMQGADDKVVVPAGKTLSVGEVVMGANAVIEVEAGATLIVNDENGIVANNATNIVVATAENNPGMVLINPAVTSNKSPKATVNFISNSYKKEDGSFIYQFFGSPMKEVTSITSSSATYKTQLDIWNVNKFEPMGIINGDEAIQYGKFSVPFAFISMLSNNPENEKQTYTMEGRLYGIDEPVLPIYAEWSGMSNAYMGAIDIVALEAANVAARNNGSNVEISIYTYKQQGNKLVWTANNELQRTTLKINPMQPFMMHNNGDMENRTLGYEDLVWTPATSAQAPARRNIASDMTKATLRVNAENGLFDLLTVAEASSFTAGRDMYDAVKYMNSDINFYITDTEKMNILATDNLDNTYLGFSCIEAGNYTISFENVEGSTLTLIDLANNTAIDMTEGATYTFAAAANESNDYRFKLVNRRDVVTGVEDVENAEVRGGIYTLTGQYMGEMNVWNTLPAGIYVVNGEKRVK